MTKRLWNMLSLFLLACVLLAGCVREPAPIGSPSAPSVSASPQISSYDITARRDLLALMLAYPGEIAGIESDSGLIYVVMKSGTRLVYDDKKFKSYEDMLSSADLQDMLSQPYPLSDIQVLEQGNDDPGRIRDYAFFSAVYGGTQDVIKANLVDVPQCPEDPVFNRCNGAAVALGNAFREVSVLLNTDKAISGFVYPLSGTFNYRDIAGTERLSMHSFAIAVDLHLDGSDYWRWVPREKGQRRLDVYPRQLVHIFEQNGFIWGGKWAHFDLVHYEYRPELLLKAKYYVDPSQITGAWYEGFPDTAPVRDVVKLIDAVLGS